MPRYSTTPPKHSERSSITNALRHALFLTLATSALALLINLIHPRRIPYIATEEYETLVPCPEPGGEVTALSSSAVLIQRDEIFIIDARPKKDFEQFRFRDAINVTYDYLDPTPEARLRQLTKEIARSGAQHVIVYGDGEHPDTGKQLGKEISGFGIKNVSFVRGGAPALVPLVRTKGDTP